MDNNDKIVLNEEQLKAVSGCGTIKDAPYCPKCRAPKNPIYNFCDKCGWVFHCHGCGAELRIGCMCKGCGWTIPTWNG